MLALKDAVWLGAEVGFLAATVQSAVGEALNERLLPAGKSADVAMRLVQTVVADGEHPDPSPFEFGAACAFHFGYGIFWGTLHATLRERLGVHPLVCAGALTGAIYTAAFSRAGGGVLLGSEPHPRRRTRGELRYQLTVAVAFAAANALIYEWARR